MSLRTFSIGLLACAALLLAAGCRSAPGKPRPEPEARRPSQILDFPTLYGENCAGCHGANGRDGAAISLDSPVYLASAGLQNLEKVTAGGVPGTLMPPFGRDAGGNLTDQQIQILTQGMISAWRNPAALGGQTPPPYASASKGNPADGQRAFQTFCGSCHGPDAQGTPAGKKQLGSLIDPTYLALISDQGLRSIIIAGAPWQGMPDWRSDATGPGARPMTDQQITDIVAWLGSFRVQTPGQPYNAHQ